MTFYYTTEDKKTKIHVKWGKIFKDIKLYFVVFWNNDNKVLFCSILVKAEFTWMKFFFRQRLIAIKTLIVFVHFYASLELCAY